MASKTNKRTSHSQGWILLSPGDSQVSACFAAPEALTCLQRYSENLLSPSSCKPSRGKILKKRSTWGRSPCFIAVSNFSVTIAFRRCSDSCRSFRLASIMPPARRRAEITARCSHTGDVTQPTRTVLQGSPSPFLAAQLFCLVSHRSHHIPTSLLLSFVFFHPAAIRNATKTSC